MTECMQATIGTYSRAISEFYYYTKSLLFEILMSITRRALAREEPRQRLHELVAQGGRRLRIRIVQLVRV